MIAERKRCVLQARRLGIGKFILAARLRAHLPREAAAKRVGISPDYLSFLERSRPDHLSDELLDKLVDRLGVPKAPLKKLQERHNRIAATYYQAYRKARAAQEARLKSRRGLPQTEPLKAAS